MNEAKIIIYTDGACSGNPGPGGWGVLLSYKGHEKELYGSAQETTNNKMELTAAIEGLKAIKRPLPVEIHTDSEYVRKGITEWIFGWKKKGWKTAQKKPVKNAELWQELDGLNQQYSVDWHWVKGHAGHNGNERADKLACKGRDEAAKTCNFAP